MSSQFVVPVARVVNLREHPNASLLGMADVLGYQMVLPLAEKADGPIVRAFLKGCFDEKGKRVAYDPETTKYFEPFEVEDIRFDHACNEGDLVVYFPADSVLPDEWIEKFGVRAFLKGPQQNRVGRIRLRGEPSFGLIQSIPDGVDWKEGDNVADYYGATKFELPLRVTCGDAAPRDPLIDPFFDKFTDIQNGRIFTDVFKDGEEVIFTEKVHGTSCKVGIVNGEMVAGSMEVRRKMPSYTDGDGIERPYPLDSERVSRNTYWFPWSLSAVNCLMAEFNNECNTVEENLRPVILYGEVYGGSIQSLDYGIPKGKGVGFRAFGLKVGGRFLDWDDFVAVCDRHGVETVPVVYRGPFSMEVAKAYADGMSTIADHIREGIVVYPVKERNDPKVGRAVLKFIGTEYELSKHKGKDTKDV
jgi:RNA ligase (TIGR02306 family)